MSRSIRARYRARIPLIGLASVVLAALVIAVVFTNFSSGDSNPVVPAAAPHFVDVAQGSKATDRTVVIAGPGEQLPFRSEPGTVLMSSLEQGKLPAAATTATVLTDANCQPDQAGVSHCLNELDLGTAKVVVRHHHKMSDVPCLTPGEKVNILTLKQYQG